MSPTILKWVLVLQDTTVLPSSLICSLVLVFVVLLTLMFRFNRVYQQRNLNYLLPPSPPNKLPILGHLHQLLGTHPHIKLQILAKKYGPDLMFLQLGQSPTLVVSSAESAREILKTHDHVFASRPAVTYIGKKIFYDKDMALQPYGEYWKQTRKICFLQLLSAKRVQSFRSVREEETAVMIDKISRSSTSRPGHVINLSEILVLFTNDITCRAAFGRKYSEEVEENFGEMLRDAVYLMSSFNVGNFIPWLAWVDNFNGLNRKVEKIFRVLDGFLETVVEEHVRDHKEKIADDGGGGNFGEEDLVDVLLGIQNDGSFGPISLGKDNIKAIILDVLAGGTETSYAVLQWAIAELLRQPKIMNEVQAEVRGVAKGKPIVTEDDLDKMHYLQCVIKETLRLHPPGMLLLPRESNESIKLQGYDIPAKTRVRVNVWAIARDPISWKEPEKFEPDRFMCSSIDYKGQHMEFIPFGAGRRGCPGSLFATSTIELGLANLLYRFDWKLPNGTREHELDMVEPASGMSPLLVIATDHLYN